MAPKVKARGSSRGAAKAAAKARLSVGGGAASLGRELSPGPRPLTESLQTHWLHEVSRIRALGVLPERPPESQAEPVVDDFLGLLRVDNAARVLPDLWLGAKDHARDLAWLHETGITAVVNAAGHDVPGSDWEGYPKGTAYLELLADDHADYPLLGKHLKTVSAFLKKCRDEKRITLVHCLQGMNRSATLVVAWLMLAEHWTLPRALRHVCRIRFGVVANPGFQKQLVELAYQSNLLTEEPAVTLELEKEDGRLKSLFRMFIPDASGCLNSGNFRSVLRSPPAHGRVTVGIGEAEINSHWERLLLYVEDSGPRTGLVDFKSFCAWLRSDLDAREIFPRLVERLHDDPSVASMITERIYLGGLQAAHDEVFLHDASITHILNVSRDLVNQFEGVDGTCSLPLEYLRIPIEDQIGEDILNKTNWLGRGLLWLEAALKRPDARLLIHCGLGVSRSSTFLIALLMRLERLSVRQALECVRSARPFAGPGAGFMEQLLYVEQEWGLGEEGIPSLQLWAYMEAESKAAWAEQYAAKRQWFPWGTTCPSCWERHCNYDVDDCEHCGKSLGC